MDLSVYHLSFYFCFSHINDATLSPLPPLFQLKMHGMLNQRITVELTSLDNYLPFEKQLLA